MNFSGALIVSLLAFQAGAFTAPRAASLQQRTSSSLNFVPKQQVSVESPLDVSLDASTFISPPSLYFVPEKEDSDESPRDVSLNASTLAAPPSLDFNTKKDVSVKSRVDVKVEASALGSTDISTKKDEELAGKKGSISNLIASTGTSPYTGWYGSLMYATLFAVAACVMTVVVAGTPPVDIVDGIREPVASSFNDIDDDTILTTLGLTMGF